MVNLCKISDSHFMVFDSFIFFSSVRYSYVCMLMIPIEDTYVKLILPVDYSVMLLFASYILHVTLRCNSDEVNMIVVGRVR